MHHIGVSSKTQYLCQRDKLRHCFARIYKKYRLTKILSVFHINLKKILLLSECSYASVCVMMMLRDATGCKNYAWARFNE